MCIENMVIPTLKPQRGDMCVVLDVEYGNSTYSLATCVNIGLTHFACENRILFRTVCEYGFDT
jgi:hypothetical protein